MTAVLIGGNLDADMHVQKTQEENGYLQAEREEPQNAVSPADTNTWISGF